MLRTWVQILPKLPDRHGPSRWRLRFRRALGRRQAARQPGTCITARRVQAILTSGRYVGCRDYMDVHPEIILRMDTANDHYIVDIDRAQDLVDMAARLGCEVTLPALVDPMT